MGYTTVEPTKIKKHFLVCFGAAFLSCLLVGLSGELPTFLAIPLCIFFGITGIGSIISLGTIVVQWFDDNY